MSRLTPEELRQVEARAEQRRTEWLAALREDPEFTRGGFPLSGDPSKGRAFHVDVGEGKPHCTACTSLIFGDEEWLPNGCPVAPDARHVYPNGDKAPQARA